MNIWIIGRDYPTSNNNMLGSFELEQAKMLADDHDVFYLSLNQIFRKNDFLKHRFGTFQWEEDGVNIFRCNWPIFPRRFIIFNKLFFRFYWKYFFRKAEKILGTPDVIHVHYPSFVTQADELFSFSKDRIKIVCTEHYTKVLTKEITATQGKQLKTFVEKSDAFISVGIPLKQSIEEITGIRDKVVVIPNVANKCFFRDPIPHETFTFVAVGRLVPVKQFDKIIEVFKSVFTHDEKVLLKIIGDGPERKMLEKLAGGDSRILFCGTLSREETAQVVASSDVLICYSRLETFGVPVIESMACGKPFIATEQLGFIDLLPENCGVIINSNDKSQLFMSMIDFYKKSVKYDSKYIIESARFLFSEEAIKNKLNDMYNELLYNPDKK